MRISPLSSRRASGGGAFSLLLMVVLLVAAYVGAEWWVGEHVKDTLTNALQSDVHDALETRSVGLDGWLFSSRRNGEAIAVLPSGQIVPIEFSMLGNPVTGYTLTVESDQRLKLLLRGLFEALP